ncbi:MAG: O-antigen ligase family protein [Solirubrobacterales bacterium]
MNSFDDGIAAWDRWLRGPLGVADPGNGTWLVRARGLALAGAAFTLAMSAWKIVGPLAASDLFLLAAVALMLPRFEIEQAKRLWFPALAVGLIIIGGVIGTLVISRSQFGDSADVLIRFGLASLGAMLLVICWRPDMQAVRSFSWLWVAGGLISAFVAFTLPDLHQFLRPAGLTPHPTHLGLISTILFGVALGLVASDRRAIVIWPGLAAAAVLFASVVVSGSRAGLGAAIVVAVLILVAAGDTVVNWAKENIVTTVLILTAIVTAVILFGFVSGDRSAFDRIFGGDTTSDQARDVYNEEAWNRFKSDPITGVGFADAGNAHNLFLQVGSAAGLFGAVAGLMLIVLALKSYWDAGWIWMRRNPPYWSMAASLAAAVVGYLLVSIFQNVLWDRNIWVAVALMSWTCMTFLPGSSAGAREAAR